MVHNKSTFIWLLFPTIQKIQFPWRFLNHSVFLFSFAAGGLILVLKRLFSEKITLIFVSLLAILLFVLNIAHFTPIHYGPITDEQKFSGLAWTNQVTSGIYDYLPKTARIAPQHAATPFVDEVIPADTVYQLIDGRQGTDWMFFDINIQSSAEVVLSQLAFPSFVVTDNNQPINYQIEPELGRLTINLSSGNHKILVKFIDTPVRKYSNYLSLISWGIILLFCSKPLWSRLILKK